LKELKILKKRISEFEMSAEQGNVYKTLIENLPQKIFLKDRNSVFLSANKKFADDLGIKPEEIRGKSGLEFFPKKLNEKYEADDRRIMES